MYCLLCRSGDVWGPDPRKDERGPQGRGESGQCRCARLQVALVGQDLTDRSAEDWWSVSTVTLVLWEVWRQKEIQDKAGKVWWLSCVAHQSLGGVWQLHDDNLNIFGVKEERRKRFLQNRGGLRTLEQDFGTFEDATSLRLCSLSITLHNEKHTQT